jgi:hypothetical protein
VHPNPKLFDGDLALKEWLKKWEEDQIEHPAVFLENRGK